MTKSPYTVRITKKGSTERWEVVSRNSGQVYAIERGSTGVLSCSCPDFIYRRQASGDTCKHIAGWFFGHKGTRVSGDPIHFVVEVYENDRLDRTYPSMSYEWEAYLMARGIQQLIEDLTKQVVNILLPDESS